MAVDASLRDMNHDVQTGVVAVCGDVVAAARALVDQVELLCTQVVGVFDADDAHRAGGFRDAGSWLGANTNARSREGVIRVKQAALLARFPVIGAAVGEGRIGMNHLRLFVAAFTPTRDGYAFRDETMLVGIAETVTVAMFEDVISNWKSLCDDRLGDVSSDDVVHEKRFLQLTKNLDGSWALRGVLDKLVGETVNTALKAATPKPGSDDDRTPGQRRHDALGDIATKSLNSADRPVVGGERPHVSVVVTAETGQTRTGSMIYLSSFTRDMLLCDATTTSVWVNSEGVPFDVGTPDTAIPIRQRRAVHVRDTHCRYPGCNHEARWSDIHHIRYRRNGGLNNLDNLVLICRYHHRKIHRETLKLGWEPDQITLTIEHPNGTKLLSPPTPNLTRLLI